MLTGWVRLWIVAAVLWWAAGAWWLAENHQPNDVSVTAIGEGDTPLFDPKAIARKEAADRELARELAEPVPSPPPTDDPMLRGLHEGAVRDRERRIAFAKMAAQPLTEEDYLRFSTEDWSAWTGWLWMIVLAPFPGAVVFVVALLIVRWIVRGFVPKARGPTSGP